MGVLISAVTRSQQVAFQIAALTSLLPPIILSGLIFPISSMPAPVKAITYVVIPRYFVSALRKIILKGASFVDLWPDLLGMLVLAVVFNILAVRATRSIR
jgi:ABC-2 type transport system permease protein